MGRAFAEKIGEYYRQSDMEAKKLPLSKIWPAEVMKKTYFEIYKKICHRSYDVISEKVRIGKLKKIWIAISQPRA